MLAPDLVYGLRDLGLGGAVVCVHSSLRSFSPRLTGGPADVVDSFDEVGATLVVPAFTYDLFVRPPRSMWPPRNATDDEYLDTLADRPAVREFDLLARPSRDLGALPGEVVALGTSGRGRHPLMSFAAVGPRAGWVVEGQRTNDAFDPLRRVAEAGGWVLLIGVGLGTMTLLHVAEVDAGRNPFIRWALVDGETTMVEFGGCGGGFPRLEPAIGGLAREAVVRGSRWRAFPARETLEAATAAIRSDPEITHCGRACIRCDDAIAGGPPVRL